MADDNLKVLQALTTSRSWGLRKPPFMFLETYIQTAMKTRACPRQWPNSAKPTIPEP